MSLLQEFEKERRARLARILAAAVPDHGIDLKRKPEPPPRPPPEPEPPRDWLYVGSGFEQRNRVHIIVSTVCVHFSISPNELKSACRIHPIVRARHVASFLLRELLALSLPKIGTILGGRDHTTILNGCKRIRDRMNSPEGDPDVIELINRVRGLPDMTDLMKNYDLWKCRSPDDDRPPDEFDDQPQGEEETVSDPAKDVIIDYINWRGVRSIRGITPLSISFENNEWHHDSQWLLEAVDLRDGKIKTFALRNIHSWKTVAEK